MSWHVDEDSTCENERFWYDRACAGSGPASYTRMLANPRPRLATPLGLGPSKLKTYKVQM